MPGCTLPEDLRQYYLDSMGVTGWFLQQDDVQSFDKQTDEAEAEPVVTVVDDERWQQLQQEVINCQQCDELAASRTQTVFGVGNRTADVLVIGEAPGRDEDEQGEPFVGRAGKLLNAMLNAIALDREQVFIANILKCRPPDNRDPSELEARNCSHFLQRQIELLQPRAILVVGRIAAQNLLSTDLAIGKMRGREYYYPLEASVEIPVIVTYHPAYLLRKPTEKRKSWQDLLRLKSIIDTWQ